MGEEKQIPNLLIENTFQTALELFKKRGYESVSQGDIASEAQCSLDELYRNFPTKEAYIFKLYECLATELDSQIIDLPKGSVATRFKAILQIKLELLQPHHDLLRNLLPKMLDSEDRLGVLGMHAGRIRSRVRGIFNAIVYGADDVPPDDMAKKLSRWLYVVHLICVFQVLQSQKFDQRLVRESSELADDFIRIIQKSIFHGRPKYLQKPLTWFLGLPSLDSTVEKIDRQLSSLAEPSHDPLHFNLAENILRDLYRYRRLQPGAGKCATNPCRQCLALHLPRVENLIHNKQPIHFVLPAFPAKSANLNKVTGPLPDFAEEHSLRFLQEMCEGIRACYEWGARITICSDGIVFNDLVGVADEEVTHYRHRLMELIKQSKLNDIEVFNLDDLYPDRTSDEKQVWLIERYAEPLEAIIERTRKFEHHKQLFNGIHRFLMEDLSAREPKLTRNKARECSKSLAYEVIRRSNAWSRLIAEWFPEALRLSIHPQHPHAEKIGLLLTPSEDAWLTPWHGVALLQKDRFILTRRAEAEARGAKLIYRNNLPSHYEFSG